MKSFLVSISFVVTAEDEEHAVEQFTELLHDNGDTPNMIEELSEAELPTHSECSSKWCEEAHEPNSRCPVANL